MRGSVDTCGASRPVTAAEGSEGAVCGRDEPAGDEWVAELLSPFGGGFIPGRKLCAPH